LNHCDFPAFVTAIAYSLSEKFNEDEIALIISLLNQLSNTLTSLAICKELNNKKPSGFDPIEDIIFRNI